MPRTRCGRRKELLFTSPPAVAAAATARATATASGSAPALAPAPPVARTEHRGTRLAAEETSARPAARAYFEEESSAGTREACAGCRECRGGGVGSVARTPSTQLVNTAKRETLAQAESPGLGSREVGTHRAAAFHQGARPRAAAARLGP